MASDQGIIIVTGSNGRIGEAIMRSLAGRYGAVIGTDRAAPAPPPGCVYVPIEITSDESVRQGLIAIREHHGAQVAAVIHLAAYYDFLGKPSTKYEEITVGGTRRLLGTLHDLDFRVEQFVFSSTMLVHRPAEPGQFIDEDWPIEATWAYPKSKVRTEQVIRDDRGEIPAVLLRIAGVYDDGCHSIPLAHQIQRIYERELNSHLYSGSTAHGQSFLHMDDLVDAIELVVERRADLPTDLPMLLGEAEALSYDELQHTLARLIHGEGLETLDIPGALAPFAKAGAWMQEKLPGRDPFIRPWMIDRANDHYALDIGRARTLLGWEPKRSLRETLPKMVAALKADPLGWYRENDLEPPSTFPRESAAEPAKGDPMRADEHAEHAGMAMSSQQAGRYPMRERAAEPAKRGPMRADPPSMRMAQPEPGRDDEHTEHEGMATSGQQAGRDPMQEPDAKMTHGLATPWAHFFAAGILGVWLITSPFALGYGSTGLTWSDVISGALIIALATVTLVRRSAWAPWANSLVGVWLLFAPLLFKAPTAAAFANDTLAGALVIAFVLLMPGMPGMRMLAGPDRPPGWSYNPSSWPQRAPIIALALLGFFLSRQMAAYQLGYTRTVWEPFFSPGTVAVLTSSVSRSFPISDAGLGAVAYMIEALMGFMGDKQRWRTMPWMVMFFGILVVPLGVASISLIILQPVVVGDWCTPCLLAALAMLVMIALTLDEVVAMGMFLLQARRERQPLWRTFWLGGTLTKTGPDAGSVRPDVVSAKAMVWGVALPWNLLVSIALGLWLMASPSIFETGGGAAHSEHLAGALVVTVAIIALADVGRAARFVNVLFGAWFVAAPWLLGGATSGSRWSDVAVGVLLIALSLPRGRVREKYGTYERFIR